VSYVKRLLDEIGLGGERLEMYFLSSAEGARFAEIATEMTERIRALGPNPLGNGSSRKVFGGQATLEEEITAEEGDF
jgi:F420-non-reducing hydrogenase iron-sulfur subunit